MCNVSPSTPVRQHEIWLTHPNGDVRPLPEYGLFRSPEDAERLCGALRLWFHLGVWSERMDRLPPDEQDDAFFERKGCVADGLDPTRFSAEVRQFGEFNDNRDSTLQGGWLALPRIVATGPDDNDDFRDKDTDVETPTIVVSRDCTMFG